jgi:hypothetical protein
MTKRELIKKKLSCWLEPMFHDHWYAAYPSTPSSSKPHHVDNLSEELVMLASGTGEHLPLEKKATREVASVCSACPSEVR